MEQLPIAIKKHRLVVLKDFFLGREGFYRRREIERKKKGLFQKGLSTRQRRWATLGMFAIGFCLLS